MKKMRRILVDIGYIKRLKAKRNGYKYNFQRGKGKGNIKNLSLKELIDWFNMTFPCLPDGKSRNRKCDYVEAAYKFGEFLCHEFRQWPKSRLKALKKGIRRPWVPPVWENKVTILPIDKIDAFIGYLKPLSPIHYMMAYLMRHANMRHIEVINAKTNLQEGTLIEDFKQNILIIHGKGRGGLTQRRTTPFLPESQAELNEYLQWRKCQKIRSKWLFTNQYGNKFSEQCGHFNNWIRVKGWEYGFNKEEVKLLTSHKIGRHAYGTDMTLRGLPERLLADNMGIRNPMILTRYQNATDDIRVRETMRCLKGDLKIKERPLDDIGSQNTDKERKQLLVDMLIEGKIDQATFNVGADLLRP